MPKLALPRQLGLRRCGEKRIDTAVGEHLQLVFTGNPLDVPGRIEPHIGSHQHQKQMPDAVPFDDANPLALQVGHTPDAVVRDQFEAADMHAGQYLDRSALADGKHMGGWKVPVEIDLAVGEPVRRVGSGSGRHEADVGKALCMQQRLRHVHRSLTIRGVDEDGKPHLRRFGRRFGAGRGREI
ncbi:hypothetical protein AJ88_20445 [Mesorhizobium amorphae CCBAU 01583]|nr:hypothetical protein AJ88_20445 [Mesorhizobium amorphae CCBAU 01583]